MHFYVQKDGSFSDKHDWAYQRLGALFMQYEPQFWFWEVGNLLFKLTITGVLCIVAQGSPFQVILALLICLINAMFLLRWAPYEEDSADVLAISCAITLTLSVLGGYVLMANHCDDCLTKNTIDPKVMDYGLIVMNSLPILIFIINLIRLKLGTLIDGQKEKMNETKVLPMNNGSTTTSNSSERQC